MGNKVMTPNGLEDEGTSTARLCQMLHGECPTRIIGCEHLNGLFSHYVRDSQPYRVLCVSRASTIFADYKPTAAEVMAEEWRRLKREAEE